MSSEVLVSNEDTIISKVLKNLATKIATLEVNYNSKRKEKIENNIKKKEELEAFKKEYKELKNILKEIEEEAIYKSTEFALKDDNSDLQLIDDAKQPITDEINRLLVEKSTLKGDAVLQYDKKILALQDKITKLDNIKNSKNRNEKINEILKDAFDFDGNTSKIDESISKYAVDFYEASAPCIQEMLTSYTLEDGKCDYGVYKTAMDLCSKNSLADELEKVQENLKKQEEAAKARDFYEAEVDRKEQELSCLDTFDSKEMEAFFDCIDKRMTDLEDAEKKLEQSQLPVKSNPIMRFFNKIFRRGNDVSKLENDKNKKSQSLNSYLDAWKESHKDEYDALKIITEDGRDKMDGEEASKLGLSIEDFCIIKSLKNPDEVKSLKDSYILEAKNEADKAKDECDNLAEEYENLNPEAKEINEKYFDNGKIQFSKEEVSASFSDKNKLFKEKMVVFGKAVSAKVSIENGDYDKLNEEFKIDGRKYAKQFEEARKQKNDFVGQTIDEATKDDEISM